LYSDNLKLSVEAKTTFSHLIFTYNPARFGLIFHSAEENNVLSTACLIIFPGRVNQISSFILGINGKSFASTHLILIFHHFDLICKLLSDNSSILIFSS
jgi:hypothetical protein